MLRLNIFLLILLTTVFVKISYAQNGVVNGAVLKKASNVRLAGVSVLNKTRNIDVRTNNMGLFSIVAAVGDTLVFRVLGYAEKTIVLTQPEDQIVYLQSSNVLAEVQVNSESLRKELMEVRKSFRSKGIYHGGKPPLILLSPFGGSPITFFHELLSKDGKRARRFERYAQRELDYHEVAARFNDLSIKKTVDISDDDLPDFKEAYWPDVESVKKWSDFDLYNYIKNSYKKFLEDKSNYSGESPRLQGLQKPGG